VKFAANNTIINNMTDVKCNIIPWGVFFFVLLFVEVEVNVATTDGFIVEEANTMGHISKQHEQVKAVVRSMAMSLTPHPDSNEQLPVKNQELISNADSTYNKDKKTSTKKEKRKHIEPSIDLKKSLQSLDLASKRTKLVVTENNAETKHNSSHAQVKETSTDAKATTNKRKSATPNVLTNSTIIGFLSKDPKYTIDSVGKPQDAKKKKEGVDDEETKKETADEDATIKNRTNSNRVGVNMKMKNSNITARDTVAKIGNHIKVFKGDEEAAKVTKARQHVEGDSNKNNTEPNDLKKNIKSSISSTGKLHFATEDDFVKLRYVKKEIEENAVKKEVTFI